ncbi:MAG: SPFH domain-containing protein [Acidobacteria bacterium]|nr:SPFH domain-containing protein [Acidobacteriota bacterium]MCB9397723.1 SPFH domain-containing protein [Acidobacteriota bacterium]
MKTEDRLYETSAGGSALFLNIMGYLLALFLFIFVHIPLAIVAAALLLVGMIIMSTGFYTLQPNQTAVVTLFGAYKGIVKREGFHWFNPFTIRKKISMRTRNFTTEVLKVNDAMGNPIEIGAVVVWKVRNAAQAVFDVDHFEEYVETQSESAIRHLASLFPYDTPHSEGTLSLRGSTEEVNELLAKELQERLSKAGVDVEESRLSHLAYAPEIAGAMLQRQQAQAVVDARNTIVEGAVSMVQMALDRLKDEKVIVLDEERKAAMVSNLLVVLCGDKAAQPVLNTSTLYH